MKEKILKILKNSNKVISGEELSNRLGISRTAIWKHITNLKKQGYNIESKKSKGYMLKDIEYNVNKEELNIIVHKLGKLFQRAEYFETIDSTNKYAKSLDIKENILIVADEQTKGRGRLGREWDSIKGDGIYMSLLIHPNIIPSDAIKITQVAVLSVLFALKDMYDEDFKIKWPNDIVYNGKKIAGILTEMTTELNKIEKLIIGIGININQNEFNVELKDKAISLKQITNNKISKLDIIEKIIEKFIENYEKFLVSKDLGFIVEDLNKCSSIIGKEIVIIDENAKKNYIAKSIDKDGNLIVEDLNGNLKKIFYGEVSIRGKDSYS